MGDKVFINYRREDSAGYAGHLFDDLVAQFGREQVFMDIDTIAPGDQFATVIRRAISNCRAMVTIIGPRWLDATDKTGRRRLDNPNDWVHAELRAALDLNVPVIPVLVDGANMPTSEQIPSTLQEIATRHAIELTNQHWQPARDRIVEAIRKKDPDPVPPDDDSKPNAALIDKLREFRDRGYVDDAALVFRALADSDEPVRIRAHQVIHAVGWEIVATAAENQARQQDAAANGDLLAGLAAAEPDQETVDLLGRLVMVLRGDLRNRAIMLAERKRLRLEEQALAKLFRAHHSPYEITKALGQGVFTATYLARDRESDLQVAVRVLRREFAMQDHVRAAFVDLVRRSVHYVHEHLALTRQSGQFPKEHLFFCVRDYIDGVTLQSLLDAGTRFDTLQAIEILLPIAEALEPVHARNEVHGGVKPSNIFLAGDRSLRLGDPGLPPSAAPLQLERLSYDFRYVAPECLRPGATVGPQADLYALGCVAYQLLQGQPPFVDDDPIQLVMLHRQGGVALAEPSDCVLLKPDGLVLRLLQCDVGKRPRVVAEVVEELVRLRELQSRTHVGRPVSLVSTAVRAEVDATMTGLDLRANPGDAFGTMVGVRIPKFVIDNAGAEESEVAGHRRTRLETVPGRTAADLDTEYRDSPPPVVPRGSIGGPQSERPSLSRPSHGGDATEVTHSPDPSARSRRIQSPSVRRAKPGSGGGISSGDGPRNYRIIRALGRGGMGTVFEVRHRRLSGRRRAMKVLSPELAGREELIERLVEEARQLAQLEHPNIVMVHDVDEDERFGTYIIMDLIDGRSLSDLLRDEGPLPYPSVLRLGLEIASALDAAHRHNIVHRDVKAQNILIDKATGKAVLTDFGIAKEMGREQEGHGPESTASGVFVGTLRYACPEQIRMEPATPRWDIYGLGAVLYEALSGHVYLEEISLAEIGQRIGYDPGFRPQFVYQSPAPPLGFQQLVEACLARDSAARVATAAELTRLLGQLRDRPWP